MRVYQIAVAQATGATRADAVLMPILAASTTPAALLDPSAAQVGHSSVKHSRNGADAYISCLQVEVAVPRGKCGLDAVRDRALTSPLTRQYCDVVDGQRGCCDDGEVCTAGPNEQCEDAGYVPCASYDFCCRKYRKTACVDGSLLSLNSEWILLLRRCRRRKMSCSRIHEYKHPESDERYVPWKRPPLVTNRLNLSCSP